MQVWPAIIIATLVVTSTSCAPSPRATLDQIDAYIREGKLGHAEISCRNLLSRKEWRAEANLRLARIARQRGEFDAAYGYVRQNVALNPNDEASWELAGDLLSAAFWDDPSRPAAIRDRLEDAASNLLRLNRDSGAAYRIRGHLTLAASHYPEAESCFRRALSTQPQDRVSAAMLIDVLFALRKSGEAVSLGREMLDRNPGDARIRSAAYRGLMGLGKAAEAEEVLTRDISKAPGNIHARLDLAAHCRFTGRQDDAETVLRELEQRAGEFAEGWFSLASFHQKAADYGRAISLLRRAEKADPAGAAAYLEKAIDIQFESANLEEARTTAAGAVQRFPNDESFLVRKLLLDAELGGKRELEIAEGHVRSLIRKRPGNSIYYMHLGRLLLRAGDRLAAVSQFEKAIEIRPGLIEARLLLARALMESGNHRRAAVESETILSLVPGHLPAIGYKLSALRALGRFAEAREVLGELRRLDSSGADLEEAYLLLMEGKPQLAERRFRKLPLAAGMSLRAVAGLAEALSAQAKWQETIALLSGDIERQPGRSLIVFGLARALALTGKQAEAKVRFEQLIEMVPGSAQAFQEFAQSETARGGWKAAAPVYRRWIDAQPANPVPYNDLAYLLALNGGDLREALELSQKALSLSRDPGVLDTAGVIHLKLGNVEEAARIFSVLPQQAPGNALVRFHAGQAELARGDKGAAIRQWTTALQLNPQTTLRGEIEIAIRSAAAP